MALEEEACCYRSGSVFSGGGGRGLHGAGGGSLLGAGAGDLGAAGGASGHIDGVDGLLDNHLCVLDFLLAAGCGRGENTLTGAELVESGLSLFGTSLGTLELALELLDAHDV